VKKAALDDEARGVGGPRDDGRMLLAEVAATSAAVAATPARNGKRALLVGLLRRAADEDAGRERSVGERAARSGAVGEQAARSDAPSEVALVACYLAGELRQRRTGLGWRGLVDLPPPADEPTLTVADVDAAFEEMAGMAGPGSAAGRERAAAALFGAAAADEQRFLRGLVVGELRQGALDALLLDAVAEAAGVPAEAVRRAAMLAGDSAAVAAVALTSGEPVAALAAIGLTVGRPVKPMLAQSAPDVAAAFAAIGVGARPGVDPCPSSDATADLDPPAVVDVKLDGIRIQVHRDGDEVRVFTRSLDDITGRVPEIVAVARGMPSERFVLDGEALALDEAGRPRPFQETSSRAATRDADLASTATLTPFFFDVLHADGRDLLDTPLLERLAVLDRIAAEHTVERLVTADAKAAAERFAAWVAAGQEGAVVKASGAGYSAGRRGAAWVKVKPRHTLDLVVLAVERGSGRRAGLLSNIHLGARDPAGGFVMLGKTFKGMTDEMLAWQTKRFTELAVHDDGWVVTLRPEQVVEVAFDGVQRSSRYPGGVALRFARVLRYRDDKSPDEADTIESVRALAPSTDLTAR
jgi:DNA ligase-1